METARITGQRTWSYGSASSHPVCVLPTIHAPVAAAGKPVASEIIRHLRRPASLARLPFDRSGNSRSANRKLHSIKRRSRRRMILADHLSCGTSAPLLAGPILAGPILVGAVLAGANPTSRSGLR